MRRRIFCAPRPGPWVGLYARRRKRRQILFGNFPWPRSLLLSARATAIMKRPTAEERKHRCTRKRRYRSQGDALDAAQILGLGRQRTAYQCPLCRHWHLASA